MAKTNFTKVEESLTAGIQKMTVSNLLNQAPPKSKAVKKEMIAADKEMLATLQFEANHCKDSELFLRAGIPRKELKAMIESPKLTEEELQKLRTFREKAEAYKKEIALKAPKDADERLVETQRKKHVDKRYNTKETWLPLH